MRARAVLHDGSLASMPVQQMPPPQLHVMPLPLPPDFLPNERHSVGWALFFAVIVPGGGQFHNHQSSKGFGFLFGSLALAYFVPILGAMLSLLGIVEAVIIAQRLYRGEYVAPNQWF